MLIIIFSGHKTPAPLSWSWFGAVKHERKPMKYEENFQELKHGFTFEFDSSKPGPE